MFSYKLRVGQDHISQHVTCLPMLLYIQKNLPQISGLVKILIKFCVIYLSPFRDKRYFVKKGWTCFDQFCTAYVFQKLPKRKCLHYSYLYSLNQ